MGRIIIREFGTGRADRGSGLRVAALIAAIVGGLAAGCGGGDGAGSAIGTVGARQVTTSSTCSLGEVLVSIERVRVKTAGGAWLDFPLATPQVIDLRVGSSAFLAALGLSPLAAGDYAEVRLVVSSADGSSSVQDGSGASAPLVIPSGSESGLKIKGAFNVPAGQVGDLALSGIDPCTIRQSGNGRYRLDSVLEAQVATAAPPPAAGPQVALSTAGTLTALPAGGFVAIRTTSTGWDVQRISAAGTPTGPVVSIPGPTANLANTAFIALQGGGYAAVWPGDTITFERFGGETLALMVQTYTAAGVPVGSPAQIDGTQLFYRWISAPIAGPVAAPLLGGGFAVAWVKTTAGGLSLFVQRFNADGSAASAAQMVAPDVSGYLGIGALSTGGYVVSWAGGARAYSASDVPVGPAQPIAPHWGGTTPGTPPAMAPLASGGAVVVWSSLVASSAKAQEQPLAPDATAIAPAAVVNGSGPFDPAPGAPAAAGLKDGSYVVAWIVVGASGAPEVHARRFSASGVPLGPDTRIDLAGTNPANPAVAATSDGGFVIAWTATGPDGVQRDYLRTFSSAGLLPV